MPIIMNLSSCGDGRFTAWIMTLVLWVYIYLQIYQILHIEYVQLFLCQ